MTINEEIFYVYIYYDPSRNNEPIYVGKGQKNRAWSHLKRKKMHPFYQRIEYMAKNGIKPLIGMYSGIDNEFACLLEQELISKFGRKDLGKGSLLNLTDGGDNGSLGFIPNFTEEHKKKLSDSAKGKSKSETAKNNMSIAKKKNPPRNFKGKHHTEETKEKLSKLFKDKPKTEEQKKNSKITCPHCNLNGLKTNMYRWHFDNCKFKE